MAKEKPSLEDIIRKTFPGYAEEIMGRNVDKLNAELAKLSKDNETNEEAKEDDEDYEKARAKASELGAPYRDAKKAIRLRTRFVISTIKDKGGA
jgi:hypothetical protein